MKKIKVFIDTGYPNCDLEETFEVEDNATENEIEDKAFEVMMSLIEWGYELAEEDDYE